MEGDTKSGKSRIVDLDDDAVAVLRAWKRQRGVSRPRPGFPVVPLTCADASAALRWRT